mmetsp:Transcript_8552/g.24136  ORF Transcript_8552/g.24136 Transcript_8552/m.24136 type:complete len:532 (-) Transcript_8552:1313-2908(-)
MMIQQQSCEFCGGRLFLRDAGGGVAGGAVQTALLARAPRRLQAITLVLAFARIGEPVLDGIDDQNGVVGELLGDDEAGYLGAELLLHVAGEGTGAVRRVVGAREDEVEGGVGDGQGDVAVLQAALEVADLKDDDLPEVVLGQRCEDQDLVQTVEELGAEVRADVTHHGGPHLHSHLRVLQGGGRLSTQATEQVLRPEVARHHDDRVAKVHGAALGVGQAAVVQHLEEDIEHVLVGLLNLVEEDHAVGAAAHGLRELPAALVADVAGRSANEPGHRVALHVLGHVDANHVLVRVKERAGERLAQLRLPHTRRAEEQKASLGFVGPPDAGAGAQDGIRHRLHGLLLAHDALVQLARQVEEAVLVRLGQLGDRNAGPAADHVRDLLGPHNVAEHGVVLSGLLALLLRALHNLVAARLEERQLVVSQLGNGYLVVPPLGLLDRYLGVLDLLLHHLELINGGLLRVVPGAEALQLLDDVSEFRTDVLQAELALGVVRLGLQRRLLHLKLEALALQVVDDLGLGVQLHAGVGRGLID